MKILLPVAVLACTLALTCSTPVPSSESDSKEEAGARELLKLMLENGRGLAQEAQYDYSRPAAVDNDRAEAQFWVTLLTAAASHLLGK